MRMWKLAFFSLFLYTVSALNLRKRWSIDEREVVDEVADFENLQQSFISQHNQWRQKEGVGLANVNWDSDLARLAEANVQQCAMRHDVQGKSLPNYKYIGQNLYMTSLKDLPADQAASKSLAAWMSEKKNYNYATNGCSGVCGHYTQVVWKDSTNIGCAVSKGCPGGTFVACNYGPATLAPVLRQVLSRRSMSLMALI